MPRAITVSVHDGNNDTTLNPGAKRGPDWTPNSAAIYALVYPLNMGCA